MQRDHLRLVWVLVAQTILLVLVAVQNREQINTDGIAYLQLASYYAHGQTHLMVSGYWGPLLSWLIAPLLWLHVPSLAAARVVMAASGLGFSLGSLALLRALDVKPVIRLIGLVLAAGAGVAWSVENISPDLLLGAWLCLALSLMLSPNWMERRRAAFSSGLVWGLAYLTKAVALPLCFLTASAWVLVCGLSQRGVDSAGRRLWRVALSRWAVTVLTCILVAAPWITVLSVKYGRFTFSTSARIAHAVVGPNDVDRYHPFARSFHRPEPGRLTSWEDPSLMPYRFWSPLENAGYFRHQLRLMGRNLLTVLTLFGDFDLVHLGLFGLFGSVGVLVWSRKLRGSLRWLWAALPVACLGAIYLPVSVLPVDQRYFYAAYPLLFMGAAGFPELLAERIVQHARVVYRASWALLLFSFLLPVLLSAVLSIQGIINPASFYAHRLAQRLRQAGVHGPMAGSAMLAGGRAGLYTAFLLGEPWYGDVLRPTATDFLASGASIIVVLRHQPLEGELDAHPGFRNLDDRLFAATTDAEQFPLKAYQVLLR